MNASPDSEVPVPSASTPSAPVRFFRLIPVLRLLSAAGITWGLLAYAWGRSFVIGSLTGRPEPFYVAELLVGIVAVMALTFRLSRAFPSVRFNRAVLFVVPTIWIIEGGILVTTRAGGQVPLAIMIALFTLTALWVVWAAWMFYQPLSWRTRGGVLVLLVLAALAFPALVQVEGLTGESNVDFAWRRYGKVTSSETSVVAVPSATSHADFSNATDQDYSQYLGPRRSGEQSHVALARDWSRNPPRSLWRKEVGPGWSAFAVVGEYAVTQEQRGPHEVAACYRVYDGEQIWTHEDVARFDSSMGGIGPRATPTIADGKVYTVGATGILNALDGETGKLLWSVDILKDNDGHNIDHGVCGSPLILGDWVIVCPTGATNASLAAYDRETGKRTWRSGKEEASYGSPMVTEIDGVRQILINTADGLSAHDAASGEILWSFPWTNTSHVNCSQPIPHAGAADRVFVSTAYGTGSALLKIAHAAAGWKTETLWESKEMKTKFTTPVLHDGHVYGLDDGILECIDLSNGKRKWKGGRYKHGQILMSHDLLIVQAEDGDVALVRMDPKKLVELGRIPALSGKTWNNPALAGPYLLVRNDHEAACYELPLESRLKDYVD